MAITKISNSGIKTGVLKYDSMLAGNAAYDPAATWLIQRTTLSTATATVTFSSIPSTYQHLQIRGIARSDHASTQRFLRVRYNGATLTYNLYSHGLVGTGSTVETATSLSDDYINGGTITAANSTSSIFGAFVIDIHDYASTTKNKTLRSFAGNDQNGSGSVRLLSGFRDNTAAITSIEITADAGNLISGSTFALYGFIGA